MGFVDWLRQARLPLDGSLALAILFILFFAFMAVDSFLVFFISTVFGFDFVFDAHDGIAKLVVTTPTSFTAQSMAPSAGSGETVSILLFTAPSCML